jgi:hypothetical protein
MMSPVVVSVFEGEEDLLQAVVAARRAGLDVAEVFSPYVVHGLDRAMDLRPSRLPWVCFVCGLLGAAGIVLFQFWASAVSWPINVGGKPWNSLPAFIPATFEMMVLCGGVGTVAAFLWVAGLTPRRRSVVAELGVTNDRFALVTTRTSGVSDRATIQNVLAPFHPISIEERNLDSGGEIC